MIIVKKLKDKQIKFIKYLYRGDLNVREMADHLGVHRTTLWRWMCHPEVRRYGENYFKREHEKFMRRFIDDHQKARDKMDAEPDAERRFDAIKTSLDRMQMLVMGVPPEGSVQPNEYPPPPPE